MTDFADEFDARLDGDLRETCPVCGGVDGTHDPYAHAETGEMP